MAVTDMMGAAGGIAAATPYGAAANIAGKALEAAMGGSSSATSGDSGSIYNNQNFGAVIMGDSAVLSPSALANASYNSRRYGAPVPTANEAGVSYTSTVTASPNGLMLVVAAAALAFLVIKKKA